MAVFYKGAARRLDAWDAGVIGRAVGLSEDHVRAIMEIEAAGQGFDKAGRVKMLFEPHVFWRRLSRAENVKGKVRYYPTDKRARAMREGLAYANWGAKPYPADSYPRLIAAMAIDEAAAIESASWGLGQIMGENYRMAGYPSARAMVEAFAADEEAHLAAMVAFIKAAGIVNAAKRGDWAAFARRYNGPGYARNKYDTRLATAYAKWRMRADTMPPAGAAGKSPPPPAAPMPIPAPELTASERQAQTEADTAAETTSAPAASPAPARGILAGFAAAFLAALAGMFWSGACLAPQFIIDWLGYAGHCTGGN